MRRQLNLFLFWVVVLSSMGVLVLLILRPDLAPSWSGVGEQTLPGAGLSRAKTLWDWLELLIIPVFVGGTIWWLGRALYRAAQGLTAQRIAVEREIADAARNQSTLEAYYSSMMELLVDGELRYLAQDANLRHIAQARTLAVLRSLDGRRKGEVLQFLVDTGLVGKSRLINLKDADLRDAALTGANLGQAHLWLANLEGADLSGANLSGADLWLADLKRSNLRGANLRGAHLGGCDLTGADLRGADLTRANVRKATLNHANLAHAVVSVRQLGRVSSLEHVVLPDGTIFQNGAEAPEV